MPFDVALFDSKVCTLHIKILFTVSHVLYRLCRNILADKPRVTRFPVDFDAVAPAPQPQSAEVPAAEAVPAEMEA